MKTVIMNMKRYLVMAALLLTLGTQCPETFAQTKGSAATEVTDSADFDELEAFSDTTSAVDDAYDSTVVSRYHRIHGNVSNSGLLKDMLSDIPGEGIVGAFIVLGILFIIFVLMPIGILIVILYFVLKNRKQKMQLAQMAVQNGQPIPQELINEPKTTDDDSYRSGIRQVFLGLGLMVFLGYTAHEVGFGIGALVFFIGLGKVVIARQSRNRDSQINNQL